LFSEGLILLLALAGPGYRYAIRKRGDHALFARLFFEEPTYLQAVGVNFVFANIFVFSALFAAWVVTHLQKKN
jgi:hypothetical protein